MRINSDILNINSINEEDVVFVMKDILIGEYLMHDQEPAEDFFCEGMAVLTMIYINDRFIIDLFNNRNNTIIAKRVYSFIGNTVFVKCMYDAKYDSMYICINIRSKYMRTVCTSIDISVSGKEFDRMIDLMERCAKQFKRGFVIQSTIRLFKTIR